MYLFTIPILLFSNYFSQISTSETSSSTQKPSTRKFNHDHDNCVCFPGGQSLVPEILNPHDNGLERLVVYIYRNPKTNQVKVFLPSPEKQALIPNIPYSIGDVLQSVTTETVSSLIQPHPNTSRPLGPDHPIPESLPIGLKWGTIEHTSPAPNYVDLQGLQPIHPQPATQSDNVSPHTQNLVPQPYNFNLLTQNLGPHKQELGPFTENLNSYYPQNLGPHTQNLGPYTKNLDSYPQNFGPHTQNLSPHTQNMEPYLQNLSPHTQNLGPHSQNLEPYPQNLGPQIQKLVPHTQNLEPYPQNLGPQTQNLGPHTQNLEPYPQKLGPHAQNFSPNQANIIYPNQINHPDWRHSQSIDEPIVEPQNGLIAAVPNLLYEPNGKKAHPVPLNPYESNNPLSPYQINKDYSQPHGPNNHKTNKQDVFATGNHGLLTFDQWFNKQMEIFREAHSPQHIQTINTDNLRSLIQQVLFENHMHIGSTGQITDAKGAPINLRNLELRPILIGNSVRYPHGKEGQQVNLPKHLPYLEGILITLMYPPKVLGVIPLGKTYVSQSGLDVSVTTPKAHIYYTAPNDNLESPSSVEYYFPSVTTIPSNVQSSYSTVTVAPANLISYTSVVESPSSLLNPYSSVIESPASILAPYSSVINSPSNPLSSYSSVVESPSTLNNPYSNVINPQYPNSNWLYSSSITSPLENVYENPNLSYSNVNVPNLSGNGVPYLTNSNYLNNGVLWGPQLNNLLQRRSNKLSKSPKHSKHSKDELHKKSKNPKDTSKPTKDVKVHPKPKPSARSYDSSVPRYLDDFSPYSNPRIVEKWSPSSDVKAVPIYLPSQKFYSHPNKQLVAIPIDSNNNNNADYSNENSFSQSIPDSAHTVAIPINLSSNSDVEYSPGSTLNHQANSQPQLIAYPISKFEDASNNNWKYERPSQIPKSISYSPQGLSENIPNIINWISSKSQKWPPISDSNSPGWPPAKPGSWSPDIYVRPGPENIPVLPISSSPDTGYPFLTNSNRNQQQKRPSGQTRRYSMASVQGVIKSLINIVLQNLAHVGESRRKGGGPNGTVSNPIEKPGEEGDRPDFRIIGGSAATGSGSPLSNKGRSGIIR